MTIPELVGWLPQTKLTPPRLRADLIARPQLVQAVQHAVTRVPSIVLNSSAPDFDAHLHELCHRLNATIALDAVGGTLTERLVHALPPRSRLLVYGALAAEACQVPPIPLIFAGLRVEGFNALDWLAPQNYLQRLRAIALIQRFAAEVPPSVRACFPLAETQAAIALDQRELGAGKVLLMPGLERVTHGRHARAGQRGLLLARSSRRGSGPSRRPHAVRVPACGNRDQRPALTPAPVWHADAGTRRRSGSCVHAG